MTMVYDVIPRRLYDVLTELTHQQQLDLALTVAVRDWIRLKRKEASEERQHMEEKWGMGFDEFTKKWNADLIPNRYSYEVERDYWDWEAAVADERHLEKLSESLL
jgi:hypothetical protein